MKIRFWQKVYLFTLILFLFCLNISVLTLAIYTSNRNMDNTERAAIAEQQYIIASFERDCKSLLEVNKNPDLSLLMNSYGKYYSDKGIYLIFKEKDEIVYSNFEYEYTIETSELVYTEFNGVKHILISGDICDGGYNMIYVSSIEYVYEEFRQLIVIYIITAVGISVVFSILLFFILKKISEPLDGIKKATENIEKGDFSVKIEEKGNDEFKLLAKSFNSMIEKINEQMFVLEEDVRIKQELVDNMAHELRTPLTSIYGYAEYLAKASVDEERKQLATKYIMSEADRLKRISEIQLNSAYIRENPPEMSEVYLGNILKDVRDKLELCASKKKVTLSCDVENVVVFGNEILLSMLFYNITENAIKACSDNGVVKMSCYDNVVEIEDNGKGMTEEEIKHILEPFYRTDKSRSRAEGGVGLGLAICNQIVNIHKAILRFESMPNKGTKVIVIFEERGLPH